MRRHHDASGLLRGADYCCAPLSPRARARQTARSAHAAAAAASAAPVEHAAVLLFISAGATKCSSDAAATAAERKVWEALPPEQWSGESSRVRRTHSFSEGAAVWPTQCSAHAARSRSAEGNSTARRRARKPLLTKRRRGEFEETPASMRRRQAVWVDGVTERDG